VCEPIKMRKIQDLSTKMESYRPTDVIKYNRGRVLHTYFQK